MHANQSTSFHILNPGFLGVERLKQICESEASPSGAPGAQTSSLIRVYLRILYTAALNSVKYSVTYIIFLKKIKIKIMQLVVATHSVIVYLQNKQLLYNQRTRDKAYDSHATWIGFLLSFAFFNRQRHITSTQTHERDHRVQQQQQKKTHLLFLPSHTSLCLLAAHTGVDFFFFC